jgi:hypothetical protein
MKISYAFIFWGLLLFLGCQKEVVLDNTDKNFPLRLNYSTTKDDNRFSWAEVNVTGFQQYVLVRSSTTIPVGGTPSGKTRVFESTNVKDTIALPTANILFDSVGFYKLYTQINDRWLESQEVRVSNTNLIVSGNHLASTFLPDSNWVLILKQESNASTTAKLVLIDVLKEKMYSSSIFFPISTVDQIALSISYNNGKPEALIATSSTFRRIALPTMTQISQNSAFTSPYSVVKGGNDFLFTTNSTVSTSFNVRKNSDFGVVKSYSRSNYFEHRTLAVLDTTTNLLVEASQSKLEIFSINPTNGTINTGNLVLNNVSFPPFLIDIIVSPDRQYFCPNASGIIYDRGLNPIGQFSDIAIGNSFLQDAVFSVDGRFTYALVFDFFTGLTKITKQNFPEFTAVSETPINGTSPIRIGRLKEGLCLILSDQNSGNARFTVQKINL